MQRIPRYIILFLVLGFLFTTSIPTSAQSTIPVRVVIERVEALDGNIDIFDGADFYPIVTIDGATFGGEIMNISDNDDISPFWNFQRQVADTATSVSVSIAIWDSDSGLTGDDDPVDVQPGAGRQLDLTVTINPCSFSGDASGGCWVTETVAGDESDNARIRFRIEVGDPPLQAEVTLTIERVRDIDGTADNFPAGDADFFPVVFIDGSEFGGPGLEISGDGDIFPNWQFTKDVPISLGSIPIAIQIWDKDEFLNAPDDQMDAAPNAGRQLDLTVQLIPCSVGGEATGSCGTSITVFGNESDRVELRFRIDVVPPPSIDGLIVRCLHETLWSQGGQPVTITAEALDNDLAPLAITAGVDVEIWVNDTTTPANTGSNVNTLTHTFTPALGQFSYGCQIHAGSVTVWSGWRSVQVGTPSMQAVPIIFTRQPGSAVDIIFIPDMDNYSGATDPDFLDDVHDTLLASYYGDLLFLQNQNTTNFWLAQDMGDYEELCNFTEPANWDTSYAFAEAGSIVHPDSLRDCARFSIRIFSGEVGGDSRVFLHETGHQPFGLADEYCCDGGYFQTDIFPNLYDSLGDCQADAANVLGEFGTCRNFTDEDSDVWYTSDPASDDLMVDNQTPRPLDIRRIEWLYNNCRSSNC